MSAHSAGLNAIKTYYGENLLSSKDLKTPACCPTEAMPTSTRC